MMNMVCDIAKYVFFTMNCLFREHHTCIYSDGNVAGHRFSAFWLRSKCSICSYQLNIWYVPHGGTTILNWFLDMDRALGACSASVTGLPGIAVPPGSAHFIINVNIRTAQILSPYCLFMPLSSHQHQLNIIWACEIFFKNFSKLRVFHV